MRPEHVGHRSPMVAMTAQRGSHGEGRHMTYSTSAADELHDLIDELFADDEVSCRRWSDMLTTALVEAEDGGAKDHGRHILEVIQGG